MMLGRQSLRPTNVRPATPAAPLAKTIPFDISFQFRLGDVGTKLVSTIQVSIEAPFIVTSIGYGLVPDASDVVFGLTNVDDLDPPEIIIPQIAVPASPPLALETVTDAQSDAVLGAIAPASLTFGEIVRSLARQLGEQRFSDRHEIGPATAQALTNGIRLNPSVAKSVLADGGTAPLGAQIGRLFATNGGGTDSTEVQFLYALFDDGSGRAFQNEPILSTAGLGAADGERPFRQLAPPIRFEPRATIRLEVTPLTAFQGTLHVALQGYRILGEAGSATGAAALARRQRRHHR
jgi:hypothetical protein